jgi:hypothetical protein
MLPLSGASHLACRLAHEATRASTEFMYEALCMEHASQWRAIQDNAAGVELDWITQEDE